jgi:integrase
MGVPILKGKQLKVRILRPSEYAQLREAIEGPHQTNLDACLLLGARYEECRRIQANPRWFDGQFIHLPWIPELKRSRHYPERWIRLSYLGKRLIPYFVRSDQKKLPSVQMWDRYLKSWAELAGLDPVGMSARTLRKTYESWLVFSFPSLNSLILLSQGHTLQTSIAHYINLPFTDADKQAMTEWVVGWAPPA